MRQSAQRLDNVFSRRWFFTGVALLAGATAALVGTLRIPGDALDPAGMTCRSLFGGGWLDQAADCFSTRALLRAHLLEALVLAALGVILAVKCPMRRRGRLIASIPLSAVLVIGAMDGVTTLATHETIDRWLGSVDLWLATVALCALAVLWKRARRDASAEKAPNEGVNWRTVAVLGVFGLGVTSWAFVIGEVTERESVVAASDPGAGTPSDCERKRTGTVGHVPSGPYAVSYSKPGVTSGHVPEARIELSTREGTNSRHVWTGRPGEDVEYFEAVTAEWSADGRKAVVSDGEITLVELDDEGSMHSRRLGAGKVPSLDPSGRYVAFVQDETLLVRALADGTTTELGPAADVAPAVWSHDGLHLAISDLTDIQVFGRDGNSQRVLTDDTPYMAISPSWSPKEDLIAYVEGGRVRVSRSDGTGDRVVVASDDTVQPGEPEWSPDGRLLSFLWIPVANPDGLAPAICVVRVDGGTPGRVPVTVELDPSGAPLWSPDGRYVFGGRGNGAELLSVDVLTGETRVITSDAGGGRWVPS